MHIKCRFPVLLFIDIAAIFPHDVRVHVVFQVIPKDVHGLLLKVVLFQGEQGLNPAVKTSHHGIGAANVYFGIAGVVEVIDTGMFQVLAYQG